MVDIFASNLATVPVYGNIDGARVMAAAFASDEATHMFIIRLDAQRVALVFGDCVTGEIHYAAWVTNAFIGGMAELFTTMLRDFVPPTPDEFRHTHGSVEHEDGTGDKEPAQEQMHVDYGGGFRLI